MGEKFKGYTAKEIVDAIKHKKIANDDEWLEVGQWINEFLKSDPPEDEKRMFVPLGWAECVGMRCDGITRWRKSICINCKRQQGYGKYCCSVYQRNEKYLGGIPNQIWANENAECPYYEK